MSIQRLTLHQLNPLQVVSRVTGPAGADSPETPAAWEATHDPYLSMNRYRTPWRRNASLISSAWRYVNAAISEPLREIVLAPAPVLFHRVERPIPGVVENRLVGMDECVPPAHGERSPRRGLELRQPIGIGIQVFSHRLRSPTRAWFASQEFRDSRRRNWPINFITASCPDLGVGLKSCASGASAATRSSNVSAL